jgi:methionine synthase I (cobalamin-dependent)
MECFIPGNFFGTEYMQLADQENFENRFASGVQVWPCSLWRNEWRKRFSAPEMGAGELLSLGHSDVIETEHAAIAKTGASALVTNTFGANAIVMEDYGEESQVAKSNGESARIAFKVSRSDAVNDGPPLVIGSIGPTICWLTVHRDKRNHVKSAYREQAQALWDAGIRIFHIERCDDPENVYCALEALDELELKTATRLLRVITFRLGDEGKTVFETRVSDFWKTVRQFRLQAFGVVGRTEAVEKGLQDLSDHVDLPLIAMVDIRALDSPEMELLHSPQSFASDVLSLTTRFNVKIVGTGVESHPDFLLALHRLLVNSGLTR